MTARAGTNPSDSPGGDLPTGWSQSGDAVAAAYQTTDQTDAQALNRHGEALLEAHLPLEALVEFDRALALQAAHAGAAHNRGRTLHALGRLHEAIDWHDRALALQPDFAAALAHRAQCRRDIGEHDLAIRDYEAAIGLDPSQASWQLGYAMLLGDLGLPDRARVAYRRAADSGADEAAIDFLLSAADGSPPPASPPAGYVAALFDAYAPRFERHLTRRLKYRAPQLLADALLPLLPHRPQAIADLGCGTGLMGALLRPYAGRLDGADISARMLERARARGIYDALLQADLTAFLLSQPATYDAVAAADVFVYIGDLEPVFRVARAALRPNGLLAFTVEALDNGDYALQPTRRYAHARDYLQRLAAAHGFSPRGITRRTLRLNGDQDVQGYVAVFAAAAARNRQG